MNKARVIMVVVVVILCLAAAGYKLYHRQESGITATGTIEVTHADITPKVGGYLTGLSIQAGDNVKAGQVIVKIARPDLTAQLLRDEAALTKAEVQWRDLQKGSRSQELSSAAANTASALSVYDKAQADYRRSQSLYAAGAISAQQLDAASSGREVAYNALLAAKAQQGLVVEGNRPDVIEAQQIEVQRCQDIVAASRSQVEDMSVASPLSGLVLVKNYEEGEYVNPGAPIATVGDMNDCWVKIYVSSTQLGLLTIGQQARVNIDAYPDRFFAGTIKEISQNAEFTPRQSITQRERANLVYAVKVKIDNAAGILKPGMPADVILP